MSALDQLKEMVEAAKAQADKLQSLQAEVEKLSEPVPAGPDLSDLQAKIDALAKERDAYKAAIEAEISDANADSARLEMAIKPVEVVEVPKVEDAPAAPAVDAPVDAAPTADEAKHDEAPGLPGDAVKPEEVENPISPLPGA